MNKTLRIKTDIGSDKVINVNLSQDIDFFEILSLKLSQRSLYKRFSANYGVVVGRVLANEAFGVPNVKVSVFVPLSTEDEFRSDIRNMYPYRVIIVIISDITRFQIIKWMNVIVRLVQCRQKDLYWMMIPFLRFLTNIIDIQQ